MGMGTCIPVPTTKRRLRKLFPATGRGSGCKQHESVFERLPVDIVHHIHSRLPVKDAARAACVSRVFLGSWRCYSNLSLSKTTLRFNGKKFSLASIVDNILEKHSGIGLEIFRLDLRFSESINDISYLDRWFQIVAHSGIKELSLVTSARVKQEYNFPCSVLFCKAAASSVQSLDLEGCTFCPTATLGCLRRLRKLRWCYADITDEGLGHLLSKSPALEHMDIISCNKIILLRLPCTLQKLTFLRVGSCLRLQSLDINVPKLSTFHCVGILVKDISVVDPCQLKDVHVSCYSLCHTLSFALAKLPFFAGNVESLNLFSNDEDFSTPMLVSSFPCLKKFEISIGSLQSAFNFDVLPLLTFLDASPALDSFILRLGKDVLRHDDSIVGGDNANCLRWKPQCQYDHLKQVMITGFRSNKNLIQFVSYILESVPLLESLTLDTIPDNSYPRKCGINRKRESCSWMNESRIVQAHGAVKAAHRYITKRVPLGVRFQVMEPCSQCHSRRWWYMDNCGLS